MSSESNRQSKPKPKPLYRDHLAAKEIKRQLESGVIVRGVLRVNPRSPTEAYVSLDHTPPPSSKHILHQLQTAGIGVGTDKDIYICGHLCRNRAINGDIVAVRILHPHEAAPLKVTVRKTDKRMDQLRAARRERLEKMSNILGKNEDDKQAAATANVVVDQKVFGSVVAVIVPNSNRRFTGTLSTKPPQSLNRRYPVFAEKQKHNLWFIPLNSALPFMLVPQDNVPRSQQEPYKKQKNNSLICVVEMGVWSAMDPIPSAAFVRTLGKRGAIDIETNIILDEHSVSHTPFSPKVLNCLPAATPKWDIPKNELKKRTDLRQECIFTIDPPTARDLDDAVSCKPLSNGNLLIGVHIADVSYFVRPNTALDQVAVQRATTTYMVQAAYPMLPSLLCEDLCSLNPGVDRLAFSVMWEIDPKSAAVKSTWFGRTIINSCCKLSYDDAQLVVTGNPLTEQNTKTYQFIDNGHLRSPASHRRISQIMSSIRHLHQLSLKLRRQRFDKGALSLNSVRLSFELDPQSGMPTSCQPYVLKDSNRLIEEFMLLANMSVAARIESSFPNSALLRRHAPPLSKKLDGVCEQLRHAGIDINPGSAGYIQCGLYGIDDPDVKFTVETILTGPMQRAAYFSTHTIEDPAGYRHYALNAPLYTHFTSPIRRYADIVVHRLLEASLAVDGNHVLSRSNHPLLPKHFSAFFPKTPAAGSLTTESNMSQAKLVPEPQRLTEIAHQCNLRRGAAKKAQDESSTLYLTHYLAHMVANTNLPGVLTQAIVTSVKQDGFTVLSPIFGIDALIYMDRMADRDSQVVSTDGRDWKLHLWKVDAASVTLVWNPRKKVIVSRNPDEWVDELAHDMSAMVIDKKPSIVDLPRSMAKKSDEKVTQHLKMFDKVTICVIPSLSPPQLTIKLAMPTIHA